MQSQTEHMKRFIGTAEEYKRQEDEVINDEDEQGTGTVNGG
jgi:hypothetical protein